MRMADLFIATLRSLSVNTVPTVLEPIYGVQMYRYSDRK
jgi:hypothetical protein